MNPLRRAIAVEIIVKQCIAMLFATLTLAAGSAAAQQDRSPPPPGNASKVTAMADGEVRKIDKEAKKITLRHGEIRNLAMPPMTMVFQVNDPALLDKVKTGDKVRFQAENVGGAYVVTAIEAAK